MSKRAKEKAMLMYPIDETRLIPGPFVDLENPSGNNNVYRREGFVKGYEQAEKDTIEMAIQWLIAHADDYIVDMEVSRYKPPKLHVGGKCWEHLKQAMEDK